MTHLTLITCTFDRDAEFERLLRSIMAQELSGVQLIVVDQNTPPRARDLVAQLSPEFDVKILETGRVGISAARNIALAHVEGPVIGFPDDDCWYPDGLLPAILFGFEAQLDYDVLTCKTLDEHFQPAIGKFLKTSQDIRKTNVFWAGNSNGLFFRKAAIDRTGGFDERLGVGADGPFGAGEETDLLLRLLSNGSRGRYLAGLHVHHPSVPENTESAVLRAARYAPGLGNLMARHGFPAWFVALRILWPALGALYFAATLNPARFRYKWVWSRSIAQGFFGTLV